MNSIPVITIDGEAATGKGTLARKLAYHLGLAYLDSGVLYRTVAWLGLEKGIKSHQLEAFVEIASKMVVEFDLVKPLPSQDAPDVHIKVTIDGQSKALGNIRTEQIASLASSIASIKALRDALLKQQQAHRKGKGLVTDGRDMGSVIFPDAQVKFFLTADASTRLDRRVKEQFGENSPSAPHTENTINKIQQLSHDMKKRDFQDKTRKTSALVCPPGAFEINSGNYSIRELFEEAMSIIGASTLQSIIPSD